MPWFLEREADEHALLARERRKGTIDVQKLTEILLGGKQALQNREHMYKLVSKYLPEITKVSINTLEKPNIYEEGVKRHAIMSKLLEENPEWANFNDRLSVMRFVFQNCFSPFLLHFTMFRDCIESQSTSEQLLRWQGDIEKQKIIGTFAQTEMGHGTNLSCLETTATYDPATEEFVMHTPTLTASKFWPGGLGKSSNYATVMAQCLVGGRSRGVHAFVLPLRDLCTHEPLPGIELGDLGPKLGWNSVDNGYLRIDGVRIPRTNMLMKHAEVTKEGLYKRLGSDKSVYLSLINARSHSGQYFGGKVVLMAATVAVRYNVISMGTITGNEEVQLIRLHSHVHTFCVAIATGYAFMMAGERLIKDFNAYYPTIMAGDYSMMSYLHAFSSGLKALGSDVGTGMIERLRVCCGQAGGLVHSGLALCADMASAAVTIDGENTVLYLQLVRYLAKKETGQIMDKVVIDASWLGEEARKEDEDLDLLDQIHKYRNHKGLEKVMGRLQQRVAEGQDTAMAWNSLSVQLVDVAKSYARSYVIEGFKTKIQAFDDVILKAVMADLFRLFVYTGIMEDKTEFIRCQAITISDIESIEQTIEALCHSISPNLVRLTDALGMSDLELDSVLGGWEGRGVEMLLQEAGVLGGGKDTKTDFSKTMKATLDDLRRSMTNALQCKL